MKGADGSGSHEFGVSSEDLNFKGGNVCEICGGGSAYWQSLLAVCSQYSAHEHNYCVQDLNSDVPDEWICDLCKDHVVEKSEPVTNQGRVIIEHTEAHVPGTSRTQSENPNFKVKLTNCSVIGHPVRLNVPSDFHRGNYISESQRVLLKVGEQTWLVDYKLFGEDHERARFSNGWSKFVQDNHLNVGNECIFVLGYSMELPVFNVRISR